MPGHPLQSTFLIDSSKTWQSFFGQCWQHFMHHFHRNREKYNQVSVCFASASAQPHHLSAENKLCNHLRHSLNWWSNAITSHHHIISRQHFTTPITQIYQIGYWSNCILVEELLGRAVRHSSCVLAELYPVRVVFQSNCVLVKRWMIVSSHH